MMIRDILAFFKYQHVIKDVIKNTDFVKALSASFGVEFKVDRMYRLYTVINPQIQNMGASGNNIIYDGDKPMVVDRWVLDNFVVIDTVLKSNQVFDLFTYNINKLDNDFNYGLVIQNVMFNDYISSLKKLGIITSIAIILTITLLIIFL